ncbi:MAG TPA: Hsp70 family protein [Polyangia bacterium]
MTTLGIDLGTTNTAAALDGCLLPLADEESGQMVLPSVVAFPPTGQTLVGGAARARRVIDPKNTIYSAKRILGRSWFARETREFEARYPFDLVRTPEDLPVFQTRAGLLTPTDIAARVIGVVRDQLRPEQLPREVVLGVPSTFGLEERKATLAAARQVGFEWVRLMDEPIATAWAYFSHRPVAARYAAVFDLGGGTFDLVLLECRGQRFEVRARGGDPYLGGDDIDQALAGWAAGEVLAHDGWDLRSDGAVFDRLLLECERAKIRLSHLTRTRIDLREVDPAAPAAASGLTLERDFLMDLCTDLVRRTFGVCDDVLGRARVKARDVDVIFLAGGTCLLPPIRAAVEQYFGRPACCEVDPMHVVAIGASVQYVA